MSPTLTTLVEKRDALLAETRALIESPAATDADLDAAEAKHAELRKLDERITAQEALEARFAQAAQARPAAETVAVVKNEERTYRPDNGHSFFADAYRSRQGDWQAAERIQRHAREEKLETRASNTDNFAGLVVPQYLTALYAPLARAGQPTVNVANKSVPLPREGMTVNISRITTGSSVGIQSTQNSSVSQTDMDDTLLTLNVATLAGQQVLSRQLLERGTPGLDQLVFADLVAAHSTAKDGQVLTGSGSSGQVTGILTSTNTNTITYTSTAPTVALLYSKVASAISTVNTTRYLPPDTIIMHPRRWAYLLAAVDGSNRPLVVPAANGPFNAAGSGEAAQYGQVVGNIMGVNVVTDASVPTTWSAGSTNTSGTEDVIIVCRSQDLLVMEEGDGLPRELRFEQTNAASLGINLIVYSYFTSTADRYPGAFSVIKGTGLVAPTF